MRTYTPKKGDIERKWLVVDADGKVLGRLATVVASVLRGKHKPGFAPHMDTGDHVIVINAQKIRVTGQKATQKYYYKHSGYPGGLKATQFRDVIKKNPERVIKTAVRGMLPHNRLGRAMLKKLKVYAGPEHPHESQCPEPLQM